MSQKKFQSYHQGQTSLFPLDFDVLIPSNHISRVINCFVDGLDITLLSKEFKSNDGAPPFHPRSIMKLLLYGYTTGVFSSRKQEALAKESIPCMWLLGSSFPDHSTICRFRGKYFKGIMEEVFLQAVLLLIEKGYLKLEDYVVDGTTISADSNKYKMVFKKNVERYSGQVRNKVASILEEIYEIEKVENKEEAKKRELPNKEKINSDQIRKQAAEISENINNKLSRKSQNKIKTRCKHIKQKADQLEGYEKQLEELGDRNSYSKTDTDACLMRMKNEELRPAYNVQASTSDDFIAGISVHQNGGDQSCLEEHLQKQKELRENEEISKALQEQNTKGFQSITADGAYGTERNLDYLEKNEIKANVKYTGYYKEKTKAFKEDPFKWQNMPYYEDGDYFDCPNDQKLEWVEKVEEVKTGGFKASYDVYKCKKCGECPLKDRCTKSNNRTIKVNWNNQRLRANAKRQVESKDGADKMRMRGHNIETVFGHLKHNLNFSRFKLRGLDKVKVEMYLFAIGYNLMKLKTKIKSDPKNDLITIFSSLFHFVRAILTTSQYKLSRKHHEYILCSK